MDTLTFLQNKYKLDLNQRSPIEIPNMGRDQLGEIFRDLRFMSGAEVGVEQGVFAEILLKANPDMTLFAIDAWKAYRGYRDHTRQEKLDRFFEITKGRLAQFGDHAVIIREFSIDAVKQFNDEELDFVYIDGNHDFINVAQDVYYWSKKVRRGGIISGHDYIDRKDDAAHVHVKQVLPGFMDAYRIKPWFIIGLEAKIEGMIRDSSRSWMYVKI